MKTAMIKSVPPTDPVEIAFQAHYEKWKRETAYMSSVDSIVEHPDFQFIVSMNHAAVPYILKAIEQQPSNLVWALNFIFNRKISQKQSISIPEACKLWIKELTKSETKFSVHSRTSFQTRISK